MRGFSHRVVLVALALAASAVLPAAPSALAAQPFSLTGSWEGHGTISPTPTAGVFG